MNTYQKYTQFKKIQQKGRALIHIMRDKIRLSCYNLKSYQGSAEGANL